jgi:hypothetical protein
VYDGVHPGRSPITPPSRAFVMSPCPPFTSSPSL